MLQDAPQYMYLRSLYSVLCIARYIVPRYEACALESVDCDHKTDVLMPFNHLFYVKHIISSEV